MVVVILYLDNLISAELHYKFYHKSFSNKIEDNMNFAR